MNLDEICTCEGYPEGSFVASTKVVCFDCGKPLADENIECQRCHSSIFLMADREWPDDPRLQVCEDCLYDIAEELLAFKDRIDKITKAHEQKSLD